MFTLSVLLVLVLGVTSGPNDLSKEQLNTFGYFNYFAVNLYQKLIEVDDDNIIFSPFTVTSALSMLYKGARGDTAEELRKALGYRRLNDSDVFSAFQYYLSDIISQMDPNSYTLNCISAMIVHNTFPIHRQYKTEIQDIFQAYVQDGNIADESAVLVDKMNTWAKIKTKGTITKLAESIDPKSMLFLASAAYFKGDWKLKFDPENTKLHPFHNVGSYSNKTNVLMMHMHASVRYFDEDFEEPYTAAELYYEGRNMSMLIILPNEIDGLYALESNMTPAWIMSIRRQMYFSKVHLTMPKFQLSMDSRLSRPLKALGIKKIFELGADFSGMIPGSSNLVLDEIKHKAMIDVNEEGSVASAITRAIMTKALPVKEPDPEFKVNHPFLFAIFDTRTNLIMFMGRVHHFWSNKAA